MASWGQELDLVVRKSLKREGIKATKGSPGPAGPAYGKLRHFE